MKCKNWYGSLRDRVSASRGCETTMNARRRYVGELSSTFDLVWNRTGMCYVIL